MSTNSISWCKPNTLKGNGDDRVYFTISTYAASANSTRICKITFIASDVPEQTFTINQTNQPILGLVEKSKTINQEASSFPISLLSNRSWISSIVTNPPGNGYNWCSINTVSGEGSNKSITITANIERYISLNTTRICTITFNSASTAEAVAFTLSQNSNSGTLSIDSSNQNIGYEGGFINIPVTANIPWSISTTVNPPLPANAISWCRIPIAPTPQTTTLIVQVDSNTSSLENSRTCTITFSASGVPNISKTIIQEPSTLKIELLDRTKVVSVSNNSIDTNISGLAKETNLIIYSSDLWNIRSDVSWCKFVSNSILVATLSGPRSTSGVTIPLRVESNATNADRLCTITATNTGNSNVLTFKVNQSDGIIVTFNGNSHTSGTVPLLRVLPNLATQTIVLSSQEPNLQRQYYTFSGWATTPNASMGLSSYTVTDSVTLYAVWTPNSYTITYNGNGNTSGSVALANETIRYNDPITTGRGTLLRTNYTFVGWAATPNATTPLSAYTIGGNSILYAVWAINGITSNNNLVSLVWAFRSDSSISQPLFLGIPWVSVTKNTKTENTDDLPNCLVTPSSSTVGASFTVTFSPLLVQGTVQRTCNVTFTTMYGNTIPLQIVQIPSNIWLSFNNETTPRMAQHRFLANLATKGYFQAHLKIYSKNPYSLSSKSCEYKTTTDWVTDTTSTSCDRPYDILALGYLFSNTNTYVGDNVETISGVDGLATTRGTEVTMTRSITTRYAIPTSPNDIYKHYFYYTESSGDSIYLLFASSGSNYPNAWSTW